jgi:hypothetical protein
MAPFKVIVEVETAVGGEVVAVGVVAGVAVACELGLPCPTALMAETRKLYAVPFVKPVTVAVMFVEVPSENVVHVEVEVSLKSMA